MPLGEWSTARIRRLWLWGMGTELLLVLAFVVVGLLQSQRRINRSVKRAEAMRRSMPVASARAFFESLRTISPTAVMHPSPNGDTVIVLPLSGADTLSVRFHNGQIAEVSGSAALRREIGPTVRSMAQAVSQAVALLMVEIAAVFLPIPIGLLVLTIVWRVKRRRWIAGATLT